MVQKLHSELGLTGPDNDDNYSKTIKHETRWLVTSLGWLRKAWTVRRCNDLDRMLWHHTPLSSWTSLTTRGTCALLTLGSPRSQGRRTERCGTAGETMSVYFDTISTGARAYCMRHVNSKTATSAAGVLGNSGYSTPRIGQEGRYSYRRAAPMQRFNNKSINWPAWFRHFSVVADVHGWDKRQRALQLVSYLDETAMLGDDEFYDNDILVKLLSDRVDPASRVSASQSRFHGRSQCHHEDADSFADAITELCHVGYPQSSPELRQELISEQFVRGQSDPELKKYLWVVIRAQKDRKLQTLIEVCTDGRQPRSVREHS